MSLFLALVVLFVSILYFSVAPALSIEEVTEKDDAEEKVCYQICGEQYVELGYDKRGIPIWFFRKFCVPACLERMRCDLSLDETQWICRDRLRPRKV